VPIIDHNIGFKEKRLFFFAENRSKSPTKALGGGGQENRHFFAESSLKSPTITLFFQNIAYSFAENRSKLPIIT
jgi:hypothetical protein